MTTEQIKALVKQRKLLQSRKPKSPDIDKVEKDVLWLFWKKPYDYDVDFMLETLTEFGHAPNLVYDDNGLFAVTCDGYQPVVTGRQKIEGAMTVFVEKPQWKKTIRQALNHYINDFKPWKK